MRHLLIVGLLFLTASAAATALGSDAQKLAPRHTEPLTIHLVNTDFETAIGFVSKHAGIESEFDGSATSERRTARLTLRMENATLDEALDAMTRLAGLSYTVVDAQTIRIYQLP
jgi:type II secretory pathway component GspD/PulD (secretin)